MNRPVVICDIDGTLAKRGERDPFDWESVGEDEINISVACVIQAMNYFGFGIILVSGRDSICRKRTESWLLNNGIQYEALYMRAYKDNRQDVVVKREIYEGFIKGREILFVLDDRDQVVKFWREELGLTCFQVDRGEF